ncbi:hypothetical protein ALQ77_05310 [Pseudomonas corrugata]|uniref:Uncharacterized protein n=1 Tax=Pseudomonas corrugata TaxID=47879 RepID=A0A3M3EN34_9PSED|nr:hypothetical protein ALQ77_05310 [Pseudomonas corrugata]
MADLRWVLEAMVEELTHVDQGNRQQQAAEQAERDNQHRLGEGRSSRFEGWAEHAGVGQVVVQGAGGAGFGEPLSVGGERRMQCVDLGIHLLQLALGFLQLVDAPLECGDALDFLIDHRADHRQVGGAFLDPVVHHLQELLAGAHDLFPGQQHRFAAGLEDRQVVHVAADLAGQLFAQLPDLPVLEGDIVHRGGEGEGEGVVAELRAVRRRQAGLEVVEPALALQQAILVQVQGLLFSVDGVQAEGDFLLGISRADAFKQGQPGAFQTIEAILVLAFLLFIEGLRQLDRLQILAAGEVVLQQLRHEAGALLRITEAVDDGYDIGAGQGLDLEVFDGFVSQRIEHGVAHRIDLQPQAIAQRIDHVLAQRRGDVALERFAHPFVEDAGAGVVLTLVAQGADGLPDQRRRTQDIALGFHVSQGRWNESGVFLVQRRGGVALGEFFRLHDHLGSDIEALFEHQWQRQGNHGEDQEDALHPLLVGEEDPEELMQIVFLGIHDRSPGSVAVAAFVVDAVAEAEPHALEQHHVSQLPGEFASAGKLGLGHEEHVFRLQVGDLRGITAQGFFHVVVTGFDLVAGAAHDHHRIESCLDVRAAGQGQCLEHRDRTADRVGARLGHFTEHVDLVAGGGLEQHIDGHVAWQLGVTFVEEGFQLVDGHALQRHRADFRKARIAVAAHGDFPAHAGARVTQGIPEVGLAGQRAGHQHCQLVAIGLEQHLPVIGPLYLQARFVGGHAGDFHRRVGPGQFNAAVGHHQLRAVELAGRGEIQGHLVARLHAISLGTGGADVKDHIEHILGPQGLFDLGHVGGLGIGRRGRENLHRHRAGIAGAGAAGKRQQQQDKYLGVHLVILLHAYRLL